MYEELRLRGRRAKDSQVQGKSLQINRLKLHDKWSIEMDYGEFLNHFSTRRGLILAHFVVFLSGLLLYTHVIMPKFSSPFGGGQQNKRARG
jgi:hypothetical protein